MENTDPKHILKGIIGITKATLGIDKTSECDYNRRRRICMECPHLNIKQTSNMTAKKVCGKCGCNIDLKAKINSEHCPIEKW